MPLQLNINPSQSLSPAVIQFMTMLQLPEASFESYIFDAVQKNPFFELDSAPQTSAYWASRVNSLNRDYADLDYAAELAEAPDSLSTLYQDVCAQLSVLNIDSNLKNLTQLLVNWLDDRAYISADDFSAFCNIYGRKSGEAALALLQTLSPAGIGARDLSECLCLQLQRIGECDKLVMDIAVRHLSALSKGHLSQIAKLTGASLSDVKISAEIIRRLDPHPGAGYSCGSTSAYIVPDVFVDTNGEVFLNSSSTPNLILSSYYQNLLENTEDSEIKAFLRENLNNATVLIQNIEKRKRTIVKCVGAILDFQKDFLSSRGKSSLLPLTRAMLADIVGINESTVCRVIKGKYAQFDFGVYPLEHFFTTAVPSENGDVSAHTIKTAIVKIVSEEDKNQPLSDQQIAEALLKDGFHISRRAVAKYRQEYNIPGSFARKI